MLDANMSDTRPPPFFGLGPVKFQEFTAELLGTEERFECSEVYGVNGQAQYGIDVLATLKCKQGIEVGQCKCWETTNPSKVREATDEFLTHLERWQSHGVKKFILFVACDTADTKIQNQILAERIRFQNVGLDYEAWDARRLQIKLRPHASLVSIYCGEHWVKKICGQQRADSALVAGNEAIVRQLGVVVSELETSRDSELEAIRDLSAQGRIVDALTSIQELRSKASWLQLKPSIRAKGARIHASLILNVHSNLAHAKVLLAEAKQTDPSGNSRPLESQLINWESGAEAALLFLGSPRSIEEWNLQQRFRLEAGHVADVAKSFASPPSEFAVNVDSSWPKAITLLIQRKVPEARAELAAALAQKPLSFEFRFAAAMVDYASSVSLAFPAWGHLTWPVPPPWNLVKRDPNTQKCLHSAAESFKSLAALLPDAQKHDVQLWRLACLANDVERQDEAEVLNGELLADSANLVPALAWAQARNYDFEEDSVVEKLRARVELPGAGSDEIIALFGLLASRGDALGAETILDEKKKAFFNGEDKYLWALHKAQLLAANQKVEEALRIAEAEPLEEHKDNIKSAVLRIAFQKSQAIGPLCHHLAEVYARTQDANVLLDLCFAKARNRDWKFIAENSERLVEQIQTQAALRLAAQGAFNDNRYELCLKLLDSNNSLFQNGRLPTDLRHVAAECHSKCGRIPQAIIETEKLVHEGVGVGAIMQLFQLQRQKGDLQATALTARNFRGNTEVPHQFLIDVVIPVIRHKDPELARDLWRQIKESAGKDSSSIMAALFQSFNLGLEKNATDLLTRMQVMADQPGAPTKRVSIEDAIKDFQLRDQESKDIQARYRKGEIPVHLVPLHTRIPLVRFFHEYPLRSLDAESKLLTHPVFIRHGSKSGRHLATPASESNDIFADLTSLLLARSLNYLTDVEQQFETIFISAHLAENVLEQLDTLAPHQPNLVEADALIWKLSEKGKIVAEDYDTLPQPTCDLVELMGTRWCLKLNKAKAEAGALVVHFPLSSNALPPRPVTLSDTIRRFLFTVPDLILAMYESHVLSFNSVRDALAVLGVAVAPTAPENRQSLIAAFAQSSILCPGVALLPAMPLFFEGATLSQLAQCGVLEQLADFCRLQIDSSELDEIRNNLQIQEQNTRLRKWLEELLQHVSKSIDIGKYKVHARKPPDLPEERSQPFTTSEMCLFDALDFSEVNGSPVWCDDRFVRSHERIGKSPLWDSFDLLRFLRSEKKIKDEAYYHATLKLRDANVRYIPLTDGEIIFHLLRAPIVNGIVVETPTLKLLRRHVAACLLDKDDLQNLIPNGNGGYHMREMEFVVASQTGPAEALITLWSESMLPIEEAQARADWIWNNLWVDMRIFGQCFHQVNPQVTPDTMLGLSIGYLFAQAVRLRGSFPKAEVSETPRHSFFRWLESRAIQSVLRNSPRLLDSVTEPIRELLKHAEKHLAKEELSHGVASVEAKAQKWIVASYIADLPPRINSSLSLSQETMSRWGLHSGGAYVDTMGLTFEASEFWNAVARTVMTGGATVLSSGRGAKLRLSRGATSTNIQASKTGMPNSIIDIPFLPLLARCPADRERVLRKHPEWFDCERAKRENEISHISTESSPFDRIKLFDSCRGNSIANLYRQLEVRLRDNQSVDESHLLPSSLEQIPRHLRLKSYAEAETPNLWLEAIERLIADEGLEEATVRLSCLPVRLPDSIWTRLRAMEAGKRTTLIDGLIRNLISPVQVLHLFSLSVGLGVLWSDERRVATTRIRALLSPESGRVVFEAFAAILKWVNLRVGWSEEAKSWSSEVRLRSIWVHATRIHQSFCLGHADAKSTRDWFLNNVQELSVDSLTHQPSIEFDAAFPSNLSYLGFLLRGLGDAECMIAEQSESCFVVLADVQNCLSAIGDDFRNTAPLLRNVALGTNCLGSYLGSQDDNGLRRILGEEVFTRLFCPFGRDALDHAALDISQNPRNSAAWATIDLLAGDGLFPHKVVAAIEAAIPRLDLAELCKTDRSQASLLMCVASKLASRLISQEIRANLIEQLEAVASVARNVSANLPTAWNAKEINLIAASLPNALWHITRSKDRALSTQNFATEIQRLVRIWPFLASQVLPTIEALFERMPQDCQSTYWQIALTLRALK